MPSINVELPPLLRLQNDDLTVDVAEFKRRLEKRAEACRTWTESTEEKALFARELVDQLRQDGFPAAVVQPSDVDAQRAKQMLIYARTALGYAEQHARIAGRPDGPFHRDACRWHMNISLLGTAKAMLQAGAALSRIADRKDGVRYPHASNPV